MKYTRYDYRRKKDDKITIAVMLVSIILAAVLLGTALSNLFIKDDKTGEKTDTSKQTNTSDQQNSAGSHTPVKFIMIQGGYYGVKSNADVQKEKLKQAVNPFTVEEEGKFRVLAGIYNENEFEAIVKSLTEKGLANTKFTYEVNTEDQSTYQIAEIIKGHLQHLTQLADNKVSSVKTDKFKTWLAELSKADESSKNYALLEEYKKYVNALPAEIGKDKSEENYIYIYELIKKIGSKK